MNKKIRKFTFVAMIFELIWVPLAIAAFAYMFYLLDISQIDEYYNVMRYYQFLWFESVPESTVNTIMAFCVVILAISVPLLVFNIKNVRNLKEDKYQRETGIYQIIAGFLSIFAINIPAAVCYFVSGFTIIKEKPKVKIKYQHEDFGTQGEYYRRVIMSIIAFVFLVFLALVILIPFYWMILTSLMSKSTFEGFTTMKIYLAFKDMHWINFKEALIHADLGLYIKNTLIVAFFTTFGSLIVIILSAFAFSRLEFKGRDFIFSLLLMTMMVPGELYVITNFVTIYNFNWLNTFEAMIFPFLVSIFYIFFLRQTFKQIPDTLYKAAKVDGCSDFKFLLRVMIPIALPTLITITILNALSTWNAYVWPRLVAEEDKYLVSIALRHAFADEIRTDYRLQMAAAALITVPILILFLFARKYIMRGVGRSGTKG